MKSGRKKDPFCSYYGLKETPDPIDELCGICGSDIWPGEAVSWDENNQICHAKCVEKEVSMDIATPDKPSVWDWTAKEMREYCAARVAAQDGDCMGENAKSCPLSGMCGECPDQWKGADG